MASKKKSRRDKFLNGFTLLEITVVICIILIMAAFGLPQFNKTIEKAKATEAVLLLKEVRSAQLRYATEVGQTTNKFENLDINHTVLKYFDQINTSGGIDVEANPETDIADIARKSNNLFGTYQLYINTNGNITCTDGASGSCENLGFTKK